jgi:hypothetical protein
MYGKENNFIGKVKTNGLLVLFWFILVCLVPRRHKIVMS